MKTMPILKVLGVLFSSLLITGLSAQVKIGEKPNQMDPSAILELDSAHMGLLITRVILTDEYDLTTIPNPANSLLVYNTNFGGGPNPVNPGFYYWREDEGRWIRLRTGADGAVTGDVWIDDNDNILTANSANQTLGGFNNVILGYRAFEDDDPDPSENIIAIGTGALQHDSTAGDARNIAIGYQAGHWNRGYNVTFMGREAGMNNRGDNVIGIGDYAGYLNLGDNVNALGAMACQYNLYSSVNAFGNKAAQNNNAGEVNALGPEAAGYNQGTRVNAMGPLTALSNSGDDVNAFGFYAADNNTGYAVNASGVSAASSNSGANLNAFGSSAAQFNQGYWVNAFGQSAAANNSGWNVNAMGYEAAYDNNGNDVVAIGQQALKGNGTISEGDGNIGIGYQAGMNIGAGFNNIAIGYDAQFPDGFASDQINIGNSIIRDADGVITLNDVLQLPALASPPSNPAAGMIYFDGAMLYCYDGDFWQALW